MARPSNTVARRREIALGLRRVMAHQGYDGATIPEIAKAAGVATGIVHYHFRDKREVLLQVLIDLVSEHDAGLEAALSRCKGDPRRELDAFLDFHLATGRNADPEALACWVALCGEALRDATVRTRYEEALTSSTRRLAGIFARGKRERVFASVDPVTAAPALMATIQGYLVIAATARPLIPHSSAAPAARAMARGLLGAMSARRVGRSRADTSRKGGAARRRS